MWGRDVSGEEEHAPQVEQRPGELLALRTEDTGDYGTEAVEDLEKRDAREDIRHKRHNAYTVPGQHE